MEYLYTRFLKNAEEYRDARHFWELMCRDLLGDRVKDWEIWPLCGDEHDGNPIFAMISNRLEQVALASAREEIVSIDERLNPAWQNPANTGLRRSRQGNPDHTGSQG